MSKNNLTPPIISKKSLTHTHIHWHSFDFHGADGFTLIELVLAIGIIGILSSIVIVAIGPKKNLIAVQDVGRKISSKQINQAIDSQFLNTWELPGGSSIPSCTKENTVCHKPICKEEITNDDCLTLYTGVPLTDLAPKYITSLPVDVVMPDDAKCIGYMVYQASGRVFVYSANMGKLQGDEPGGMCEPIVYPSLYIPQNLIGAKGNTITIPVMLAGTTLGDFSISGMDLAIAYDDAKFTAVDNLAVGSLLGGGWTLNANTTTSGIIRATFSQTEGPIFDASAIGQVFTFDLTIAAGAPNGTTSINLRQNYEITTTQITDNDINELTLTPPPTNSVDDTDGVLTITD